MCTTTGMAASTLRLAEMMTALCCICSPDAVFIICCRGHAGIFWNGVGNTYSHNSVRNSPHVCFLGGGNEGLQPDSSPWGWNVERGAGSQCTFDNNTLETCAYECGDCAAFYTCGQQGQAWVNRGNWLKNSRFIDIGTKDADFRPLSGAAIYLDVRLKKGSLLSYSASN